MEEKKGVIYCFHNIKNNKRYIGQTVNLHSRYKDHFNSKLNDEFHQELRKNPDNFEFIILEEVKETELDNREIYWIDYYNSFLDGYNNNKGGNSHRGFKKSEEMRKKLSQSAKKRFNNLTDSEKEIFSNSIKEAMKNPIIRKKLSDYAKEHSKGEKNGMFGKHHSEKTRMILSKSKTGEKHPWFGKHLPEDMRKKISDSHKKPVVCLKDNEIIKIYQSIADAAEDGFTRSNISQCCTHKIKSHKGFQWMYYDDYLQQINNKKVS